MRLKKLEVYGFKSFAQRTEIVFNEGITGIVGPNGSGKSNIGDAVRWVLGEQSAKTLRGASMSDVIFNGTQKRKPLSYCEVSLIFDNEDRALPMDYAEVMVTRRVYRSGDSEYFLNRSACRLKDIIDLFRDTGIGKEGYSIIGQGRIDEILSRRSEDRRLVFEEAAGIMKFKTRKEEADRKLAHTLDNLDRLENVLEELRRQLGPLEEQSKTAREYIELSSELKVLDMNLFVIRTDKAKEKLAELNTELNVLQQVLDNTEKTLAEKNAARDALQEEMTALEEKITMNREKLNGLTEQVNQDKLLLSSIESRRAARQENRERIYQEQQQSQQHLSEMEQLYIQAESEQTAQAELVAKAEQLLTETRQEAEKLNSQQQAAEDALEEQKQQYIDSMNRAASAQNDQTRLNTMRDTMETRLKEVERLRGELTLEEERLEQQEEEANQRLYQENLRQKELADALKQKQDAFALEDQELIRLRQLGDKVSGELQAAQSRCKLLGEMIREMDGFTQSVKRAVQYASHRGMSGVRGVLSQLIRVPREYETAIDMALGAAQQNIVTDNEDTAKQLINYLRENKLGRATFLPVSAIRGKTLNGQEKSVLRMRGCVGVASDLVECDAEFRPIVESLLGRTVIAENLDVGIPIMRAGNHSFRLVTLSGDVMHSGGSMTGGSTQARAVNLIGRTRELRELEEGIARKEQELNDIRSQVREGQERKEQLRRESSLALEELHQQEIAVAREQERTDNAALETENLRHRMESTDETRVQIEAAIEDIDRQLNDINTRSDGSEWDQDNMEKTIADLQEAVNKARQEAAEAAEQVMVRTLQLNDLRHGYESLGRDRSRYEQEKAQAEQENQRRKQMLLNMDAQEAQDAEDAAKTDASVKLQELEVTRQNQIIVMLETDRNHCQRQQNAIFTDIENLHQVFNRDSDRQHRLELSRSRQESDLKQMNDRIWNTYEITYAGALEFRQEEGFDPVAADRRAAQLSTRIRAMGPVNVKAVEEYADTKARADELMAQQADLHHAEEDLRELIDRLLRQMETTFVENFSRMQEYFSETFTQLFGGGHAELTLMDPSDPLNCGIEVNAQPPGKKLQLLSLLSGGERALTAIAILFAMLKLKPTPFCILDEIEAALDDANIGYYADYLKQFSEDTQFIVVTHRKGTMERCNSLYGVAMEEQGVSKMVSVALQDYQEG